MYHKRHEEHVIPLMVTDAPRQRFTQMTEYRGY